MLVEYACEDHVATLTLNRPEKVGSGRAYVREATRDIRETVSRRETPSPSQRAVDRLAVAQGYANAVQADRRSLVECRRCGGSGSSHSSWCCLSTS